MPAMSLRGHNAHLAQELHGLAVGGRELRLGGHIEGIEPRWPPAYLAGKAVAQQAAAVAGLFQEAEHPQLHSKEFAKKQQAA